MKDRTELPLKSAQLAAKGGAVLHGPRLFGQPSCHHAPEVYAGIGEEQAAALLREFFKQRRD